MVVGVSSRFQSLLSWISLADSLKLDPGSNTVVVFQSLLSWISLADTAEEISERIEQLGFNPCCRGSRSLTAPRTLNL